MSGCSRVLALAALLASLAAAPAAADSAPDRVFADFPVAPSGEPAAAAVFSFAEPVSAVSVRAVTLHLRSGGGWLSLDVPTARARGDLRAPLASFSPDAGAGPAAAADVARVSLWLRPGASAPPPPQATVSLAPPAAVAVAGSGPMADRCARLLERAGVAFDPVPADCPNDAIARRRVVFLPDASMKSSSDDDARLSRYVADGGKLVVFYSASPELAKAVGVRPGAWEKGRWNALALPGGGCVPHRTENLICPAPGKEARVLATWLSPSGRDTGKPAVVLARGGAWFSHIPPRAYPDASRLVRDMLAALAPDLPLPAPPTDALPPLPALPDGFTLGAWTDQPLARPPAALNTLFATPGPFKGGNAARHVWLRVLLAPDGSWRDPADPAVRRQAAARAVAAAKSHGTAGVHLDYVRTPAGEAATPERTAAVTALVQTVAEAVRAAAPGCAVSAAVFPAPEAAAVNQDWPSWVKEGLVDFVCPMIYEDDPAAFRARLEACLAVAPAAKLVPGIGTGADESQASPAAARDQLRACVEAGCRGAAFFALDEALEPVLQSEP